MTDALPEPSAGLPPERKQAESELALHAFKTAGALQLLIEHMETLGWRTDEYTREDLANVASSQRGMSIRAAMSSGDDDAFRTVTGRDDLRRL